LARRFATADARDQARHIITIYAPVRRIKRMIAGNRISRSTVVLRSRISPFRARPA
jgi:hypothetical protein